MQRTKKLERETKVVQLKRKLEAQIAAEKETERRRDDVQNEPISISDDEDDVKPRGTTKNNDITLATTHTSPRAPNTEPRPTTTPVPEGTNSGVIQASQCRKTEAD
jgi:hypothetical protein